MTRSTRLATLAIALALPLAVSACGGGSDNGDGLDHNDPEAVARAYVASYYDCGDRGAGLRWDLQLHNGGEDTISRADALASETTDGCRPTRVPKIETFRGGSRGDVQEIVIANPDACASSNKVILVMLRGADGYVVDPDGDYDTSDCVRHGSTG